MAHIRLDTKGRGVNAVYSKLRRHPNLGMEMANIEFEIGDAEVNIRFETWEEMINFCKRHNFSYKDERELKDKEVLPQEKQK